jgi:N-acetylglucosamine-6-phosphate deacetylase
MQASELLARHYQTGSLLEIAIRDGRFHSIKPSNESQAGAHWIAPPIFDLQVNGYGGVDFQSPALSLESLEMAARSFQAEGGGKFLLTLVTAPWERLIVQLQRLVAFRNQSRFLQSAIPGFHIEGPFLSSAAGFHGAHNPAWMLDPTPQLIDRLKLAAGDLPLLLTLAPERTGAIDAIRHATAQGIKVSLGHSDGSAGCLAQALAAGARMFTHLANACPQSLDRHDNILWRVADAPFDAVSLIPDTRHVSPALFRLLHRALKTEQIIYVTDAMSAAGAKPGRYWLGEMELEVGADGVVHQPGKSNFAGSSLTSKELILRAASMLGISWRIVWAAASERPRRFMDIPWRLEAGAPAEFALVRETDTGQLGQIENFIGS